MVQGNAKKKFYEEEKRTWKIMVRFKISRANTREKKLRY